MRNVIALSAAAAAAAIIGVIGAAPASADAAYGSPQSVTDRDVVTSYTVWAPKPSTDVVNVPIVGKLYEAKVLVAAVQGSATPSIPFFNARSANDNYRVLWQAYASNGLSGATLPQGSNASGKIYFDVTGAPPTSVVYNDAVQDRMKWGGS